MTWLLVIKRQWSVVFLLVLSFLVLTKFNIDPDFGWHMAYGETFLKTHEIIRGDHFSWTMPAYVWGNSYFLYQILVAYIFNKFGYLFLAILFGLVASLGVLILSPFAKNLERKLGDESEEIFASEGFRSRRSAGRRYPRRKSVGASSFKNLNFLKVAFVVLGAAVAGTNLGIRPHTISFLFFGALLLFLEKGFFSRSKYIPIWFLFFGVWANLHRAFILGLLIFGLFVILEFFQRKKKSAQELLSWAGCFLAGVLGTFLTPYPFSLWKSGLFFDLTTFENLRYIAEWQPLALAPPASIFLAASGIVFVFILRKKHKEIGPTWSIISAFLFSLAFVSGTFTFFWAAIFIFIVSRYLDFKISIPGEFWSRVPIIVSIFAVFLALFLNFVTGLVESYNFDARLLKDNYPVRALTYLDKEGLAAGLFNNYEWGGFIDWKYPGMVFIDGRMAGWRKTDGTSILGDYMSINQGNCDIVTRYGIDMALVKKSASLICFADWKVEYQDDIAKVLRRIS